MEVPNTYLDLFFGYSVIWGILAIFVIRMVRSQSRLSEEIRALQQRLESDPNTAADMGQVNQ